ncbi:MAG: hypothetical protein WC679_01675 [Bacteroidales bacterium]|jgi:hypothetical protein
MQNTKRKTIKSLRQFTNNNFVKLFKKTSCIKETDRVSLKVCGIGFRFGKLEDGTFFVEGSKTGIITNPNDFIEYALEKQYIGMLYQRCVAYSDMFHLLKNQKFVKDLPNNVKVVCEFLYNPLHIEETEKTIQFVNYHYDKDKLGTLLSIVPLEVIGDYDINNLYEYSTDEILFINPILPYRWVSFARVMGKLYFMDFGKPAFEKTKKDIDNPFWVLYNEKIEGYKKQINDLLYKEFSSDGAAILGDNIEGFVIELDKFKFKVKKDY